MVGRLDLRGPAKELHQVRVERQLQSLSKAQLHKLLSDKTTFRIKPLRNKVYGELIRRVRTGV